MTEQTEPTKNTFKSNSYMNYTPQELINWIQLITKRASHRNDLVQASKDLEEAANYAIFLNNKLRVLSGTLLKQVELNSKKQEA